MGDRSALNAILIKRIEEAEWEPHAFDTSLSSGFMSLMVWADFMRMSEAERTFVFGLVEQMRAFEKTLPPAPVEDSLSPGTGQPVSHPVEPAVADSGQAVEEERLGVGEAEPPPAKPQRSKSPCEQCGKLVSGQGMTGHMRTHTRENWGSAQPDAAYADLVCRFCSSECGSEDSRKQHESMCDKRLQDRASVAHVHAWKIDTPKDGFAKGKCKGCGTTKQFSQDASGGKWGNQPLNLTG